MKGRRNPGLCTEARMAPVRSPGAGCREALPATLSDLLWGVRGTTALSGTSTILMGHTPPFPEQSTQTAHPFWHSALQPNKHLTSRLICWLSSLLPAAKGLSDPSFSTILSSRHSCSRKTVGSTPAYRAFSEPGEGEMLLPTTSPLQCIEKFSPPLDTFFLWHQTW